MPEPQVKQGNADAHRQQEEPETEPDGGEVEVEATGGGDPDGGDPDGGDGHDQTHGGDDDDGGSLGGILTNKKVIIALVAIAVIGLYLASRQAQAGGSGNGNRGGESRAPNQGQMTDSLGELEDDLQAVEGDPNQHIPQDKNDPLAADGYVLENTSIFPSISGREEGQRGGA